MQSIHWHDPAWCVVQAKLNSMMIYLVHHHIDCTKTSLKNLTAKNLFAAPLLDKELAYEPDNVFFGAEKLDWDP